MIVGDFGAAKVALAREEPDTFLFYGETFTVADEIGAMPLMEFAAAAEAGVDSNSLDGLAAMHSMIADCMVDGDWSRFKQTARKHKASGDELLEVCTKLYEVISGRPSESPSASAPGPSATSPTSSVAQSRAASLGLVPVADLVG